MNESNVYEVDHNPGCVVIYDKVNAPNELGVAFSRACEFCGRSEEVDHTVYKYMSHSCVKAEKIVRVAEAVMAPGATSSVTRTKSFSKNRDGVADDYYINNESE